jgi:hypothetical protein
MLLAKESVTFTSKQRKNVLKSNRVIDESLNMSSHFGNYEYLKAMIFLGINAVILKTIKKERTYYHNIQFF